MTGVLNITATTFTVKIFSLSGSTSGNAANFDMSHNYSWQIASASGGFTGLDPALLKIDYSGFTNAIARGTFSTSVSGNYILTRFSHRLSTTAT